MTSAASPNTVISDRKARQAPLRITAKHRGIIAQVRSVLIYGADAHVLVAAASNLKNGPSSHDVLNARVCTYVISQQAQFRSVLRFYSHLCDQGGRTQHVEFDCDRTSEDIRLFYAHTGRISHPIPAPVLAYLLRKRPEN